MNHRISKTDLAWVAGLIDGEGCIHIGRRKPDRGHKSPMYSMKLSVSMTHQETIRRLSFLFGGPIWKQKARPNKSTSWNWQPSQAVSKQVLLLVQEFLFTKCAEAELALQFCSLPKYQGGKNRRLPQNVVDARDIFYTKMRQLKPINKLGVKCVSHS